MAPPAGWKPCGCGLSVCGGVSLELRANVSIIELKVLLVVRVEKTQQTLKRFLLRQADI